jgi:hypothetical protein
MERLPLGGLAVLVLGFVMTGACGDDDAPPPPAAVAGGGGSPEQTGKPCETAEECYPNVVEPNTLQGEAYCMDRVRDGYCTHTCDTNEDCCAVPGECDTDLPQICAPFESTNDTWCFLSCEEADIRNPDGGPAPADDQEFCQRWASPDFICRSTGGGSGNRKICAPFDCGVGAACSVVEDCAAGLECIPTATGGYCTQRDCSTNADCPQDSFCVTHTDGVNYCLKRCSVASDCSFCRPWQYAGTCSDQVVYAEDGTSGTVCLL